METELVPEVKCIIDHVDYVRTVCFSPDQTKLCSAGDDKKVFLTNFQNNEIQSEKEFTGHNDWIFGSDFSWNGEFVATSSCDETIRIWNVSGSESGKSTELEGHTNYVKCVRFLRKDPHHVISGSDDETIKLWSVERKKVISTMFGVDCVLSVDILPDNRTLVSGGDGHSDGIRIWDLRSGKCFQTLNHHTDDVVSVQFHPDSFSLASGSDDKTVKIFDFRTFQLLQEYKSHSSSVLSVCFHPSGKYLISGSIDKDIKVFDLLEKKVLFTLNEHVSQVECVKFSPDGKLFASGSNDKKAFLWDFPLGRIMIRVHDQKDIDEEERVNYLVQQNLLVGEDEDDKCYKRNVLKIRIDNFFSLYSYKFFFVCD